MNKEQECHFLTLRLPYLLLGPHSAEDRGRVLTTHVTHEKRAYAFYEVGSLDIADKLLDVFRYGRPRPGISADSTAPGGPPGRLRTVIGGVREPIFAVVESKNLQTSQQVLFQEDIESLEGVQGFVNHDP